MSVRYFYLATSKSAEPIGEPPVWMSLLSPLNKQEAAILLKGAKSLCESEIDRCCATERLAAEWWPWWILWHLTWEITTPYLATVDDVSRRKLVVATHGMVVETRTMVSRLAASGLITADCAAISFTTCDGYARK
jgi:hypothetical protein